MARTLDNFQIIGEGSLWQTATALLQPGGVRVLVHRLDRRVAEQSALADELAGLSAEFSSSRAGWHLRHVAFERMDNGLCWMDEFPGGVTLERLLELQQARKLSLTAGQSLALGIRMADAAARAHEQGAVLSPFAPCQVVFTGGRAFFSAPRLAATLVRDRQLARKLQKQLHHWIPPEAFASSRYSAASDVWTLAAVTYRLITGRAPLASDRRAVSTRAREPEPPSRINRTLPFACDAVFLNALAASPARRPRDAAALARAFRQLLGSVIREPDPEASLDKMLEATACRDKTVQPVEEAAGVNEEASLPSPGAAGLTGSVVPETSPAHHRNDRPEPAGKPSAPSELPPLPSPPQEQTRRITPPAAGATGKMAPLSGEPVTDRVEIERMPTVQTKIPASFGPEEDIDESPAPAGEKTRPDWPAASDTKAMEDESEESATGDEAAGRKESHPRPGKSPAPAATAGGARKQESRVTAFFENKWALAAASAAVALVAGIVLGALLFAPNEAEKKAGNDEPAGPATAISYLEFRANRPVELILDGEVAMASGTHTGRLVVPAGPHRIVVLRGGKKLLDRRLELAAGQWRTLELLVPRSTRRTRSRKTGKRQRSR